jgi:hypothetical protein
MRETDAVDTSSSSQARSALLTLSVLAFVGSGLGVSAILKGNVSGAESVVVLSSGIYGLGTLVALLGFKQVPIQKVATLSTCFYTLYLCAGILTSLLSSSNHNNLFVYLEWYFPLLVFNKLVNNPAIGRFFAKLIVAAPLVILCSLLSKVLALFPMSLLYLEHFRI